MVRAQEHHRPTRIVSSTVSIEASSKTSSSALSSDAMSSSSPSFDFMDLESKPSNKSARSAGSSALRLWFAKQCFV